MKESNTSRKPTVKEALNETYASPLQEKRKAFTDKARKKEEAEKDSLGGF
ncbi:hypothetical protein [Oceanobacillus sp. CAU 1775]